MKYILIGFSQNVGTFTDKVTGELVSYSNRSLRFITDSGAGGNEFGFSQFTADKLKLAQLADILKVQKTDEAVNNALLGLLSKDVNVQFAPINNELKLVWFGKSEK